MGQKKKLHQPIVTSTNPSHSGTNPWLLLFAILSVTFIAFFPSLNNGYVFWDDPEYVVNNPFNKAFDIKSIFSEFYMANYHPLTMLSYAVEYKLVGSSLKMVHFNNVLLHLINTSLVFFFTHQLFNRSKISIAVITALLFGIHPMHVESVTWMSERKDVLYAFFYFLAMMMYLRYIQQGRKMIFLVYTFILSLLSLLSKGQAVTLPIVFILIDFIWEKQFHWKSLMEKIPFFILSALFGWIAIKAQGAGEAINANYYDNFSSIFFGSYGLLLYLYKFFLPIHLSGLHPYPFSENMKVPGFVYAASVIIPLIVVLTIKTYRTKKVVSFGILFFLFAIAPMLKLLPVGDTIMAERYTYIPYTGLFIIIGWFYNQVESSREWRKYLWPYRIVLGGFVLFFAVATFNRTKVWKDSQSFWGNVVEQYPDYWRGNHCLGYHFYEKGDYAKAYDYFTRAIQRDKYCPPVPYSLRGVVLLEQMKKPDEAIVDFKRVIELSHSPQERLYQEATMNLGLAYHRKGDYVNALQTYEKLMPLIPNDAKLHYHRGLSLAGQQQYSQAIEAYEKSLQLKPDYVDPLLNRGVIYTDNLGNYDLGIKDFKQVLQLQPGNMDAAINIGVALYKKGELDAALSQYNQILEAMPGNGRIYFLRALAWVAKNDLTKALEDAEKAKQLGIAISDDMIASWKRR